MIRPAGGPAGRISIAEHPAGGEQLPHPDGKSVGDLIETRRYAPGDPLKLVLWKVYARTGQMLVRSAERTAAPSRKALAYFIAAPGDEPTAGATRGMLEGGSLGNDIVFGADGSGGAVRTVQEAVDQIIHSAAARDRGGEQLAEFLARGAGQGITSGILFVPRRPGAWLDRVGEAVAGYPGKCQAIVGTDGGQTAPATPTGLFSRVFCKNPRSSGDSEDVDQVCQRLEACGVRVTVVDRFRGTVGSSD